MLSKITRGGQHYIERITVREETEREKERGSGLFCINTWAFSLCSRRMYLKSYFLASARFVLDLLFLDEPKHEPELVFYSRNGTAKQKALLRCERLFVTLQRYRPRWSLSSSLSGERRRKGSKGGCREDRVNWTTRWTHSVILNSDGNGFENTKMERGLLTPLEIRIRDIGGAIIVRFWHKNWLSYALDFWPYYWKLFGTHYPMPHAILFIASSRSFLVN